MPIINQGKNIPKVWYLENCRSSSSHKVPTVTVQQNDRQTKKLYGNFYIPSNFIRGDIKKEQMAIFWSFFSRFWRFFFYHGQANLELIFYKKQEKIHTILENNGTKLTL